MKSHRIFRKMKREGKRIVMLTAYDACMGRLVQDAGADLILVGDSLGMVVLGYDSTLSVTMDDMVRHTAAVRRGAKEAFITADMPWMSYHLDSVTTRANAARLITEAGADAVKLEGGSESRLEAIRDIVDCEIPVVAHLGLTPQSVHQMGGYRVQGTSPAAAEKIMAQAKAVQDAGAFMLVLEGIPEDLGRQISQTLDLPVIGIGAGRYTDGQVLVFHDVLGFSKEVPKFVLTYARLGETAQNALAAFVSDVREKKFPRSDHVYQPVDKGENPDVHIDNEEKR